MYRHFLSSDGSWKSQVMAVSLYQFHAKSIHDLSGSTARTTALVKLFEPEHSGSRANVKIFTNNKGIYFCTYRPRKLIENYKVFP